MTKDFEIHTNSINNKDSVLISIVTPVYKNDPSRLLNKILDEIHNMSGDFSCEVVIVDDGSQSHELISTILGFVNSAKFPAKLIEFKNNKGRSAARNALIEHSVGKFLLFLDSDMLPDCPNFLRNWADFINETSPTIAYGGFSILQADDDPKLNLAKELAARTDCLSAIERNERGPVAVATSNLLVRRDIMEEVPFDCDFVGWGWEDVDWAFRANKAKYAVVHFENPATHLGLDEPKILLKKLAQAGPNFRHITNRHPQMLNLQSAKAALLVAKMPFLLVFTPLLEKIILIEWLNINLRAGLMRIWRAFWAAKSLLD